MKIDKINCGDWAPHLEQFITKKQFDNIFLQLQKISRNGSKIVPTSANLFRPFRECNYDDLKVVILVDGPYNTIKNNKVVADGLAFSCAETNELEKELEIWYDGIERDVFGGLNLDMSLSCDLSQLASQGVLLLNSGFTSVVGGDTPHYDIWGPFLTFLYFQVLNTYPAPLAFVFIGEHAQLYEKYIFPMQHFTISVEHPVEATKRFKNWDHQNLFTKVNKFLLKARNESIEWSTNLVY